MEDIIASLNEPQKEAVLDFEHPLLVLAGAGSGKTRVITSKVAYAIKEMGYRPWQILAVTFTNKAAKEMRERVEAMLPDTNINGLEMRTFHSLGAMLLRRYGMNIGLSSSFNIYDDTDSLQVLSNMYPEAKKQELRPYMRAISIAKDRSYDPDHPKLMEAASRLPDFRNRYSAYEAALRRAGCVDFADLICRTNELLETNKEVRDRLRSQYKLILVDEYQDSNGAQFRMLSSLVGPDTQIVVVGDDDQSIYRFRGAEIQNILHFPEDYQGARVIKLEENYRSTKSILKIASSVIANNKGRHEKTIFTNNEEGNKPELMKCLDAKDEALRIASILRMDRDYSSTAVLFRTNAQSVDFETVFASLGIPHQVIGALRFYDREEVKDVLSLISFILNPRDQIAFTRIINKPARGIGKVALERIMALNEDFALALEEALKSGTVTGKAKSGVEDFLSALKEAIEKLDSETPAVEFLTFIIERFGIKKLYEGEEDPNIRKSRLENLSALVNAVGGVNPGREGLISFLETITLDSTTLGNSDPRDEEGVKLMTMHTTKGLEFDRVFVTGLEEEMIPGSRSDLGDDDIEEERRLFYVAVTRARKLLYLSYTERRMVWGYWSNQNPSRFLREIPENCYNGKIEDKKAAFDRYQSRFAFEPRRENKPAWGNNIISTPKSVPVKPAVKVVKKVEWKPGDKCLSPDYGKGCISAIEERNGKKVISVKYDNGKTARYIAAFANLTKL